MAVEEIAKACASRALILMVQELGTLPIQLFGTDGAEAALAAALRQRRVVAGLRPVRARGRLGPRRRCAPRAVRDGDEWVINGTKNWITNAAIADFYVVFADDRPREPRASARSSSRRTARASRSRKLEHKLGIRGSPTGQPVLRGRARPGREPDRRRGQGPRRSRSARSSARGSAPRRRPSASRRARPTTRSRYAKRAHRLRQADHRAPGDPVQARRHGDADGRRARAALQGVRDGRPQRARPAASTPRWRSCSPPTRRWR